MDVHDKHCVPVNISDFTTNISPPSTAIIDLSMIERKKEGTRLCEPFNPAGQFEDYRQVLACLALVS